MFPCESNYKIRLLNRKSGGSVVNCCRLKRYYGVIRPQSDKGFTQSDKNDEVQEPSSSITAVACHNDNDDDKTYTPNHYHKKKLNKQQINQPVRRSERLKVKHSK